ncbi:MAG: hypothetical protein N2689_04635 [Verrucomicrobiae bacterium]|nr:hypothetical protein [Verrucomicrobiae bacterium]
MSNARKSFLTSWSVIAALALAAGAADVPPKIDYKKKSDLEGKQFGAKEFTPKAFQFKEFDVKQFPAKSAPAKDYDAKASRLREPQYAGKDYAPPTAEQIARWRKTYEAWREREAKLYSTTNVPMKTDAKLERQIQAPEKSKSLDNTFIAPTPENLNKPVSGGGHRSK